MRDPAGLALFLLAAGELAAVGEARVARGLSIVLVDGMDVLHPVFNGVVDANWDSEPPYHELPDQAEVRLSLARPSRMHNVHAWDDAQGPELKFKTTLRSNDTGVATAYLTTTNNKFGRLTWDTYSTGNLIVQCREEGVALISMRIDFMRYDPVTIYGLKSCVYIELPGIDVSLRADGPPNVVKQGLAVEPFIPDDDIHHQFKASAHHDEDVFYIRSMDGLAYGFDAEVFFDPAVISPNLTLSQDVATPNYPSETWLKISYRCLPGAGAGAGAGGDDADEEGRYITSLAIALEVDDSSQPIVWGWRKDCSPGLAKLGGGGAGGRLFHKPGGFREERARRGRGGSAGRGKPVADGGVGTYVILSVVAGIVVLGIGIAIAHKEIDDLLGAVWGLITCKNCFQPSRSSHDYVSVDDIGGGPSRLPMESLKR